MSWLSGASGSRTCSGKIVPGNRTEKIFRPCEIFYRYKRCGRKLFLSGRKERKYQQIFPEFAGYVPEYSQSHLPVREQKTAEGHAVRAVYLYSAMADLAYEYQDETLLDACKTLWNNMTEKRMYITGGIGSSGLLERFTTDYDLPNDRNYSESCASIGLAMFGNRMAQITKDAKYADIVEKALYNTVLAGIAMDGRVSSMSIHWRYGRITASNGHPWSM